MTPNDSASPISRATPASANDEDLYALVHEALKQNSEPQSERREGKRSKFVCVQLVAPYTGGAYPEQADFLHVECRDLSTSGFSFVTPQEPETERLVVALGRVPFQFFIAEIVKCNPIMVEEERLYRVGCHFRLRIER